MNLVPFPGKIIVRRFQEAAVTEGGIIRPRQSNLPYGEVLAAGAPPLMGRVSSPYPDQDTLIGKVAVFSPLSGLETNYGDEAVWFYEYDDILGFDPRPLTVHERTELTNDDDYSDPNPEVNGAYAPGFTFIDDDVRPSGDSDSPGPTERQPGGPEQEASVCCGWTGEGKDNPPSEQP